MVQKFLGDKAQDLLLLIAFPAILVACSSGAQSVTTEELPLTNTPTRALVEETNLNIKLPDGDPETGFSRAIKFRCYGCHVQETMGPQFDSAEDLPNIMERGAVRIAEKTYQGNATTNLEYIVESILLPEIYLIPGEWEDAMPTYFGEIMTEQDLADVIAWMGTAN
jgi:cytochrome c2